jgi:hypothetical protein
VVGEDTHTKATTMNRNKEKDWQKDPTCLTGDFEENDEVSEENLIPLVEKDILERYLDNCYEPSYFLKGSVLSFFFCLTFWAILIFL